MGDAAAELDEELLPAQLLGHDLARIRACRRGRRDTDALDRDLQAAALQRLAACARQAARAHDPGAQRSLGHALGLLAQEASGPPRAQALALLDEVAPADVATYWRALVLDEGTLAATTRVASGARAHLLRQAVDLHPVFAAARVAAALHLEPELQPDEVLDLLAPLDAAAMPAVVATLRGRAQRARGDLAAAVQTLRLAVALESQAREEHRRDRAQRRTRRHRDLASLAADRARVDVDVLAWQAYALTGLRPEPGCWLGRTEAQQGDIEAALATLIAHRCDGPLVEVARARARPFELALGLHLSHGQDLVAQLEALQQLGAWGAALALAERTRDRRCARQQPDCEDWRARARTLAPHVTPEASDPERDVPGLIARLQAPRRTVWREQVFDPSARAQPAGAVAGALPASTVVFAAQEGARAMAVVLSRALDPRGEVSRGGYFAYLREGAATAPWRGPYYLGFAEHYPYVVLARSPRPAFDGDRLQLSVEVRELDEDSISFPPVALRTRRQQQGVLISCALADLVRDGDGDGLSDLYEEKLATDPDRADSDGDGLRDDEDALPLTPERRQRDDEQELLAQALYRLAGRPDGAIVHAPTTAPADLDARVDAMRRAAQALRQQELAAGPREVLFVENALPLFAGTLLPLRVVVMPPPQARAYDAKFGRTFMLRFGERVYSPDRQRVFFTYSYGWRGGTFLGTRDAQGWRLQELSTWIS